MGTDDLYCLTEINLDMLGTLIGLPHYADILSLDLKNDRKEPYIVLKIRGVGYRIDVSETTIPYMTPELRSVVRTVIDWRKAEDRKARDDD